MPEEISIEMVQHKLFSAVLCDALDSLGFSRQSPRIPWSPITVDMTMVGRCRTTLWGNMFHEDPEPYKLELQAVDSLKPGEVLIAAAGGSMRAGIWGELLSTAAKNRGCIGAVVDGAVRDLTKMREMQFPVWALGCSVYDSRNRTRVLDVDVPVEIDGVNFSTGDLVVADSDGVVVVPRTVETEVIELAWKKVHSERQFRDAIRDQMSASEAFDRFGIL